MKLTIVAIALWSVISAIMGIYAFHDLQSALIVAVPSGLIGFVGFRNNK